MPHWKFRFGYGVKFGRLLNISFLIQLTNHLFYVLLQLIFSFFVLGRNYQPILHTFTKEITSVEVRAVLWLQKFCIKNDVKQVEKLAQGASLMIF